MKVGFNYNCLPEAKKIHLKERLTHFPDLLNEKCFMLLKSSEKLTQVFKH